MRRNLLALLALLPMLFHGMYAYAACTAGNPNFSVAESTPDLTDNGDGTVTHAKTGLMWKQCVEGLSGVGCLTDAAIPHNWADALTVAATANTAGHTDWRLPNKKELESIVEYCGYTPAINTVAFPATPDHNFFWSSSTNVSHPEEAWMVTSEDGATGSDAKTVAHYIRLVRNGSAADSFDALTAPVLSAFGVSGTTTTATTLAATSNVNATGYWIIVARNAATPTAAQVKAGVNYTGGVIIAAGHDTMTATVSKPFSVTGLAGGTDYDVYVVAENVALVLSAVSVPVVQFSTNPIAPTATTDAASAIGATGATLNGTVNANGADTTVGFDYGLPGGSTTHVAATPGTVFAAAGPTAVAATISGLSCNTTYNYRVSSVNSVNTTNGGDHSFTTTACVPTATTTAASAVGAIGATLNGNVNDNGAITTVTFDYGLDTGYGTNVAATTGGGTVGAGAGSTAMAKAIAGLTCNTTYHFRVNGVNSAGPTNGGDQSFTTSACVPTATTTAASGVSINGATLNGNVNANGATTTVSFDYGLTTGYGTNVAATTGGTVSGNAGSTVAVTISGLNCNATYHFRVKGVNSAGTTNGSDLSFITSACGGTVPGAPTINNATPGPGRAAISFTAPASNGGSPITGYIATCTASGQITRTASGAGSPLTVVGLKGGVQYSCSVAAINGIGTGASSAALLVTPLVNKIGKLIPSMIMLLLD